MIRAAVAAAVALAVTAALPPGIYTFTDPSKSLGLRHCDYQGYATQLESGNDDFSFQLIPALNGNASSHSFQSMNYPSMDLTVVGATNGASEATRIGIAAAPDADASSFIALPGLSDPALLSLQVAAGKFAGMFVTRSSTGQRSGSCAANYNGAAGDVFLSDGSDKVAATWATSVVPPPPPPNVTVSVANVTHAINPRFFGCHFDPGYTQQPRGWYSQLVYGESFEQGTMKVPSWVKQVDSTADAAIALDAGVTFNSWPSMSFAYTSGSGSAGLANRGMGAEGLSLQAGKDYEGFVFVQGAAGTLVTVALQDFTSGGAVLASATLTVPAAAPGSWSQLAFTLTPTAGTSCAFIAPGSDPTIDCAATPNADHACVRCGGQLLLALLQPSAVHVGYVFLQPGAWGRVGTLPVLASAGEMVKTMGINVIRQGGTVSQSFRWKDWRGRPWERPSMQHVWGDSLVSGWGPFEMLDLSDELGFEAIITLAYDLNNANDFGDLVEYVWGNASTPWGGMRIADRGGNPAPYSITTWELGNEQENPDFVAQVESMEARAIQLGRGGELRFMYPTNQGVSEAVASELLAAGFNASRFAPDIHIGAGGALEVAAADWNANPAFAQSAINCETNAGTHDQGRALEEAADLNEWLNVLPPVADRLWARTASFCNERSGHFDGFDQGLSFFLPNGTWLQPPGHVHAMIAATYGDQGLFVRYNSASSGHRFVNKPVVVRDPVTGHPVTRLQRVRVGASGQTVSAQSSSSTKQIFVRVTNSDATASAVSITLTDAAIAPSVTVWTLAAASTAASNSPQAPLSVAPVQSSATYPASGAFTASVPAYSFTVFAFSLAA